MKKTILILFLIFGGAVSLQCDIPGCENNEDGNHTMLQHIIVIDPTTIDSRVFSNGRWWL